MPHRLALPTLLLAALTLTGCGTPLEIEGDPTTNGLLILDARVRREFILDVQIHHAVSDGAIANLRRVGHRIKSVPYEGLLVFPLPPGNYVIQRLATVASFWSNWDNFNYVLGSRDLPDNLKALEVRAGNTTYIGPVVVQETSGFSGIKTTIRWDPDRDHERDRLEWVRDCIEDEGWRQVVERRLNELKAQPTSE